MIEVGDEQIYRQRDYDPSQRVRVLAIDTSKRNPRYEIEFLDGETAGKRDNVPGRRLRGPWADVARYDETVARWQRFTAFKLSDAEDFAVVVTFETLIPEDAAVPDWNDHVCRIVDAAMLEPLIGVPVTDIAARVESITHHDGEEVLSPQGTLLIAELACRVNPMPVLDFVVETEQEYREMSKRGRTYSTSRGKEHTSPEQQYSFYLEYIRPRLELLRSWCGHRAVTMQERLAAAEAEVRRLDLLVTRSVDYQRKSGHSNFAEIIAEAHEEERITPTTYRPVVDRPLMPSETPVQYIEVPRRRWR